MRYRRLMTMAIVFASSPFAPAAFAQQKTMQQQKWEYKIVNSCDPKDRGTDIQQLGEEGWELVATDLVGENQCATRYFKRPKGSGPKQATKQPSQQTAAPQCSVPLDKAPTIRSLRLGMSVDELLSIFTPNTNSKFNAEKALKNADSSPNYGLATFMLYPSEATTGAKEKFAGISTLNFKTFDGRVVEINVTYDVNSPHLYPSWTIDEWAAKVSNTFSLPGPNNWETSPNNEQRKLKCKELEVEATLFSRGYPILPGIGIYQTPRLTITDPSYRQVMEQRAKSDQEKKQREFVF
jgi:hypothetical protein